MICQRHHCQTCARAWIAGQDLDLGGEIFIEGYHVLRNKATCIMVAAAAVGSAATIIIFSIMVVARSIAGPTKTALPLGSR